MTSDAIPPPAGQKPAAPLPPPKIAERAVVVRGVRLATAMSDAPRALLARAPLVVLPSAGFVWRDYTSVMERFAPERRVFAFDWPGFGGSARPSPNDFSYTLDTFSDIFAAWLDAMGIARAVLLGSAMGAVVALRFAAARPLRAAGLALVSPLGFARPGVVSTVIARAAASTPLLRLTWPLATSLLLGPTTPLAAPVAERHRTLRRTPDFGVSLAAHAALWRDLPAAARDLPVLARPIAAPALVVRGALDPLVTAADAHRAAESIGTHGALEVTLPGAGHLPFLQQPERFGAALSGLLNTVELAAAQLS
ncbi:MAG TPA: alpha/beta hydrolase [Ktedonobacterales bacterium]|nr:alpha/beta hydrolase [Ktedonobacterales bacterium]